MHVQWFLIVKNINKYNALTNTLSNCAHMLIVLHPTWDSIPISLLLHIIDTTIHLLRSPLLLLSVSKLEWELLKQIKLVRLSMKQRTSWCTNALALALELLTTNFILFLNLLCCRFTLILFLFYLLLYAC